MKAHLPQKTLKYSARAVGPCGSIDPRGKCPRHNVPTCWAFRCYIVTKKSAANTKKKTYVIQPKSQNFNPFFGGGGGVVKGSAGIVNY